MSNAAQTSLTRNREKLLFLTQFSMLLAIEAIVCFTPLGTIPIGPLAATLSSIPVIATAIFLGTGAGALMGFFFGLFSFIVMTFTPPSPAAFVFTPFYSVGSVSGNAWSLVICFVPRILIGVVTGLCIALFKKLVPNPSKGVGAVFAAISGILGSLTNTFLVLGGIYLFFGQDYAVAIGTSYELLLGLIGTTVLTNGVPEAILGGVIAAAIMPIKDRIKFKL